ncbi:MAG: hypothetical protein FWC77_03060 [Defluviitaleaceae bacterium]|nr:hypothetical protein [Defluviitaleaceae bacterium]
MFIKTVKYDLLFSKTVFLSMAGIIIALAAILRQATTQYQTTHIYTTDTGELVHAVTDATSGGAMILGMVMMAVAVISVLQVMIFFQKSFFDDTGYMMLTLPVKRFTILASKLAVAMVWLNFMLLAAAISVVIVDPVSHTTFHFMGLSRDISFQNLVALIEVNIIGASVILLLFFVIVLAHSRIWVFRVGSFAAAVVGVLLGWGIFILHNTIGMRHFEEVADQMRWENPAFAAPDVFIETQITYMIRTFERPIIGVDVGRIPVGDGYLDIYLFGISVITCVLAFWAAIYLLKKRVNI